MDKSVLILIVLMALTGLRLFAQNDEGTAVVVQDLENWNSIGLKYKASKKSSFQFDQGLRLVKNASEVDQVLSDLSYKYKTNKYLSLGVGLRYSANKGANEEFDNDFRYNIDANIKHDFNRFDFKYRLRFQNKNELGKSAEEGDVSKRYMRLKARVKYNVKGWKLDPIVSSELFRSYTTGEKGFDNVRVTLGTKYSLKKMGDMSFFYRLEKELNTVRPQTTYVLGLKYVYTIK